MLDDAELQPFGLERFVHVQRRLEVQLVKDDVAALLRQVHPHDDDVLAVRRVLDEGNFVGSLRADQLREAPLQIDLLIVVEVAPSFARAVKPKVHVPLERAGCGHAQRVDRR